MLRSADEGQHNDRRSSLNECRPIGLSKVRLVGAETVDQHQEDYQVMLTATDVIWKLPAPIIMGIAFGAFFALTYMPFNRWLARKFGGPYKSIAAMELKPSQRLSLALSAGSYFGLFMFVKSVAEAAKISDVFWFIVMFWGVAAYFCSVPFVRLQAESRKSAGPEAGA